MRGLFAFVRVRLIRSVERGAIAGWLAVCAVTSGAVDTHDTFKMGIGGNFGRRLRTDGQIPRPCIGSIIQKVACACACACDVAGLTRLPSQTMTVPLIV